MTHAPNLWLLKRRSKDFSRVLGFVCVVLMCIGPSSSTNAALTDAQYVAQISAIEIVNDGTNNAIYVRGTFTPTLPCATQGFFVVQSDPFEKEIVAMLFTAKTSGRSISYTHVYCVSGGISDGYSRGNGFVLL